MTYDTNKLNYLSGGSSSGNTGYIQMKEMGSGSISFQIKFQAVGDGSTTLKVDTTEMYDVNDNALDTPSATKTVKVIGSARFRRCDTGDSGRDPGSDCKQRNYGIRCG